MDQQPTRTTGLPPQTPVPLGLRSPLMLQPPTGLRDLLVASLMLFLLFFDRFIHRLRPLAVAALAGLVAIRTIATVTRAAKVGTASAKIATGEPVLIVPTR